MLLICRLLFSNCSSLIRLPNISNWETGNVTNMSMMFSKCSSIKDIPDISKWNTNKVIDMSELFSNCKLLLSLPNIFKWNITNVTNISKLFYECSSLNEYTWTTIDIENMNYMRNEYPSLISSLSNNISERNSKNINKIENILNECSKLNFSPNISTWNTQNIKDMSCLFYNCTSLKSCLIYLIGIFKMLKI